MRTIAVAALALILPAANPAVAQARVDFSPMLALYAPLVDLADQNGSTARQDGAAMFGVRTAVWPSSKIGVEFSVAFGSSGVNDGASIDEHGQLWLETARLLYGLTKGTTQCAESEGGCLPAAYLAAGVGLISRGGAAWNNVTGTSSLGGSLGAGFRVPAGKVSFRVEGELFLYSASFTQSGATVFTQAGISKNISKFQEDLLLSLQLSIPLGGGAH